MKLNDKEKANLITALKKEYNRVKQLLDDDGYYLFKSEEIRQSYTSYANELKEKCEAFEKTNEVEIDTNTFDFDGNGMWGLLGVISLAAILGGGHSSLADQLTNCCCDLDPQDNKNLN